MNPFQKMKDPVLVSMLVEVAKKNRKQPDKMIQELVMEAYRKLK
jgi:hypothetical protein